MFEKILVPIDGSGPSWNALKTAEILAERFQGELIVLHAAEAFSSTELYVDKLPQGNPEKEQEWKTRIGSRILQEAQDRLKDFAGRKAFLLKVGYPSDVIVETAKQENATSIVIGSRGLSGIAEFLLGSVSSRVLQYAPIPVMIVK